VWVYMCTRMYIFYAADHLWTGVRKGVGVGMRVTV